MNPKRVVITGMGCVTPIGNSPDDYWQALLRGQSGAAPITRFDASLFKTRFACEVKGFNPLDHFERSEARRLDLFTQFGLVATEQALRDANLLGQPIDRERIGVVWGSGNGGMATFQDEIISFVQGGFQPAFSPFFVVKGIINTNPGLISIKYGLGGVSYAVVAACASSNITIINAYKQIKFGDADVMVAGGSESTVNIMSIGGFNAMRALSIDNDCPTRASRPFDATRNGFVMGEGAGALILEEFSHAQARGATIYAELTGTGLTSDSYHISASRPDGSDAARAIRRALAEANLSPADVDYLNAHATSTQLGDPAEMKAVEQVFGDCLPRLNISATKSMTGHLIGAAGVIEAIACIKSIGAGYIPPTINLDQLGHEFNPQLNLTPHVAVARTVRVAMNNSFGFGGHNATTIFQQFE